MGSLLHARTLAVVTDLELVPDLDELEARVRAAVLGGVDLVQVRAKSLSNGELGALTAVMVKAASGNARVVVNGDPEAAISSGADGVHLPEDSPINADAARSVLGRDALIGKSVHSPDAAVAAESDGANYLIAGTVFPSRSHPGGPTSGLDGISQVVSRVSIPVIGIGGITAHNCRGVIDAGADGVAVIGAIIGEFDSYRAARALNRAVSGGKSHRSGKRVNGR